MSREVIAASIEALRIVETAEAEDLLPMTDEARWPRIEALLRQDRHEKDGFKQTLGLLAAAGGDS